MSSSVSFANPVKPFSEMNDLEQNPLFGTRPWEQELSIAQKEHVKKVLSECNQKEQELERKRREKIRKEKILKEKMLEEKKLKEKREKEVVKQTTTQNPSSSIHEKTYSYQKSVARKIEKSEEYKKVQGNFKWNGPVLTRSKGVNHGPHGRETYYNLPMRGVVRIMRNMGNKDKYWIRSDGCKMLGNYIMVAAKVDARHKRGRISQLPTT